MNQNPQRVSSENCISSSCQEPLIPTNTENTDTALLRRRCQQALSGQQLHGGESGSKLKHTQGTICGRSNGPVESEEHETQRRNHISHLNNVHYMLRSLVRRSPVEHKGGYVTVLSHTHPRLSVPTASSLVQGVTTSCLNNSHSS